MSFSNPITKDQVAINNATFQANVLNSIEDTAGKADAQMQTKAQEYEQAKLQESIYEALKNKTYVEFRAAKESSVKGKNQNKFNNIKSKYDSIMSQYTNASNLVDIKRSSYQDAISYSAKMNNSLSIAQSVIC